MWVQSELGRSPGGRHGNPLQYSCLENPMKRGAWWATVHGVTKNWTGLKRLSMYTTSQLRGLQPHASLQALTFTACRAHVFMAWPSASGQELLGSTSSHWGFKSGRRTSHITHAPVSAAHIQLAQRQWYGPYVGIV